MRQLAITAISTAALFYAAAVIPAQAAPTVINIDVTAGRHPINPNIYGVSFGSQAVVKDLHSPLNRYGGDESTQYNWRINADNRGNDFYFESLPDDSATPGERGDTFVSQSRGGGAEPMIAIPTIGWVAKLGPNRGKLASFSIAKYGGQTDSDALYFPDAGNGILASTGQPVTGNDPNDANTPADSAYQKAWVRHLVGRWGLSSAGGVRYYILDNEPSLWHATHRDVFPTGATMAQVRDRILDYSSQIKAVDLGALVVGPEEWGWSGYFYSGFDQQYGSLHGWDNLPDRQANGGQDYLPWLLDQLHQSDLKTGRRSLDLFSVHYYPQSGEYSDDTSSATQLLRNRSTRSLWDPNYVDVSWINDRVKLIPRLKQWVAQHDPGLQVGITEYSWGADGHMNGATAEADVLGIFGREGLDLACRWTAPAAGTPVYEAMKLYRNYDGAGSAFGDTSVSASAPAPDSISAFAALRSTDGALTMMLVNKQLSAAAPVAMHVAGFTAGAAAHRWRLAAPGAIVAQSDVPAAAGNLNLTLPAQSVSLLVLPPAAPIPGDVNGDGKVTVADATVALRFALGLAQPTAAQLSAADIKGSGSVTVADVTLILYIATHG